MKRLFQILNILALVFALIMNALVGAQLTGLPAINNVSDSYATLLTPAGYAFGIWSIIYLLLIGLAIYQARDLFKPKTGNKLPLEIGPLFFISSIMNGLWTYIFVTNQLLLSVIVISILALSLYLLIIKLKIALSTPTLKQVLFVWWPILIYTGWVTVAAVVNIASLLQVVGIGITPLFASLTLIVLASALLVLLAFRNVRELLLASTWGIAAIGAQQISVPGNSFIAVTAFSVATILLVACVIHGLIMNSFGARPVRL